MSTMTSPGWRDSAVCLSLANLCYVDAWHRLQSLERADLDYFRKFPLSEALLVTTCNVLLLGLALSIAMCLVRRSRNGFLLKVAQCVFFLLLTIALSAVETSLAPASVSGQGLWALGLAAARIIILTGPVFVLIRGAPSGLRVARTIVLLLAPLFPLLVIHSAWFALRSPASAAFAHKPLAPPLPDVPTTIPPIIWLVFDEMDERLAFVDRPRTIAFPEFDRFRRQAVHALAARPPARWTLISMPALISGRLVAEAEPIGVDELSLRFTDSRERVRWSALPSIFTEARQAGLNTAVIGWYHPYCRVLTSSLTDCSWQPYVGAAEWLARGETWDLARSVWVQARRKLATALLVTHFGPAVAEQARRREGDWEREEHMATYRETRERALEAVANPRLGLIFVHWPIPHPSGRHQRDRSTADLYAEYVDNLTLSDHAMGELRRVMERAGRWERAVVLITADHGLRNDEVWSRATRETAIPAPRRPSPAVPFLLKLPGQDHPLEYAPPFNTVLTRDLLLALVRGDISGPEGAVRWLDRNRARFPVS